MKRRNFILIVMSTVLYVLLNGPRQSHGKLLEVEPASSEEISRMIDSLPNVLGFTSCLSSECCAKAWIDHYNKVAEKVYERASVLNFRFDSNMTDYNQNMINEFSPINSRLYQVGIPILRAFKKNSGNWSEPIKRILFLATEGIFFFDDDPIPEDPEPQIPGSLTTIYAQATVCKPDNPSNCVQLEPELTSLMANSRNYSELLWAWKGWHEQSGGKMKDLFTQSVRSQNRGARNNGLKDLSEYWIQDYETEDFEKLVDDLFLEIKPFYQELHAYVRNKLDKYYQSNYNSSTHDPKLIQAHLLGNMWGQAWQNIMPLVKPFPNAVPIDYTKILKDKGYTPLKIFQEAEKFFLSIGLYNMTPAFWERSMFVKPENRSVLCQAVAYDFTNSYDFRIRMCAVVDKDNFQTAHHEMGHIEYYMAYSNQTLQFRGGANQGFHEAVGDTIALSVINPTHFKAIGLLENQETTYEQDINNLMEMALSKFVFLPFGYLVDKWRWNVFRGKINESNYNSKWWEMRKEYQGLEPPVPRSEHDFDPGAKYHVAAFVPYSKYFISNIIQFQFFKALCNLSEYSGPLHRCDFYNSKVAGAKLKEMLQLGQSKHWTYAMKVLTNETTANSKAIFEYFKPLIDWLKAENQKAQNQPGW